MKLQKKLHIALFFLVFFKVNAQVGIGTTTPNPSSVLDIESTTQGVLTPRMTTAQRTAIATPAEGLLVFDTEESSFYVYNGSAWVPVGNNEVRDNYKLVKSAADLADELTAGGGVTYLLDTIPFMKLTEQLQLLRL